MHKSINPIPGPSGILIVEDHDQLQMELRDWLREEFPESSIFGAGSGEEAWDLMKENQVPVVLMDINLPGENGIALTRKIKASMPDVRVIVLTIMRDDKYKKDAFQAGADGFVYKAEMNSVLIDEIQRVAASRSGSNGNT